MLDTHAEPYELLTTIVRALVDRPEEATVLAREGDILSLHVQVSPLDLGKLIGKQGRTARAIRTLTTAAGHKINRGVAVDLEAHPAG